MPRAFILLMDSFGVGEADDADKFGDKGANTLGSIMTKSQYLPQLSNLTRLGLMHILEKTSGIKLYSENLPPTGAYGFAVEKSTGKDTPSGHWEIAGVPVMFEWGYFPKTVPCFPKKLTDELIKQAKLPGVLGNKHASGTDIIQELGEEHIKSGKPIVYTSADSVFQIAAHEKYFGLEKLFELCDIARKAVNDYHIGRVIARPFLGEAGNFYRTSNRRDIAVPPPSETLLDRLIQHKREVISIGKIADIFAHRGISQKIKANGNKELFDALLEITPDVSDGSLVFVNFVDFDMLYGHRRDVVGYAKALEEFDRLLPQFEELLLPDDFAIITADHGCDPTFPGSDHTREFIPIVMFGKKIKPRFIGKRNTFADIGQTIADHLDIPALQEGESFLSSNNP